LNSKNIEVGREHVHGLVVFGAGFKGDRDLRVIDAGEVTCTTWLMFFWAKRE
jgi:hypothetical protein